MEPIDASGAAAIAGIIKNQRRNPGFSKEPLNGKPLWSDFTDSVTDDECGLRWLGCRFDEYGIEQVLPAGDGVAAREDGGAFGLSSRNEAEQAIAYLHHATGDGQSGGEYEVVQKISTPGFQVSAFVLSHPFNEKLSNGWGTLVRAGAKTQRA